MKWALLLSSWQAPIDALIEDPPMMVGMLDSHARGSSDPRLPTHWHLEDVTARLIDNMWSTERVLRIEGTIVPDIEQSAMG